MQILQYTVEQFAGIRDQDIMFSSGMNVISGENETGKSTMIAALFHVLTTPFQINRRTDREFMTRFFPANGGNTIDTTLKFSTDNGTFVLQKIWDKQNIRDSQCMLKQQGGVIWRGASAEEKLQTILQYGTAVYSNLIFGRQNHEEEILAWCYDFFSSQQTADIEAVRNQIARAFSVAGGISEEKFLTILHTKLETLGNRWDILRNAPEKGRDIDNPWVRRGTILQAYYHYRTAERACQEAEQVEEKKADLTNQLAQLAKKKITLEKEWETLLSQKSIIQNRIQTQHLLTEAEQSLQTMQTVSTDWSKRIHAVKTGKKLAVMWEEAQARQHKNELTEKLNQLSALQIEIDGLQAAMTQYTDLPDDKKQAEYLFSRLDRNENRLHAARLHIKTQTERLLTEAEQSLQTMKNVSADWSKRLQTVKQGKNLAAMWEESQARQNKKELTQKLEQLSALQTEIDELQATMTQYADLPDDKKQAEYLFSRLDRNQNRMNAAKLHIKIQLQEPHTAQLSAMDGSVQTVSGTVETVAGFMQLSIPHIVQVQAAPEGLDLDALQQTILQDKTALQAILNKYHVVSVQELSNQADTLQQTAQMLQQKQTEKRFLLQNETTDTLQAQAAACIVHLDMQIPPTLEKDIQQFLRTAGKPALESVLAVHESAIQSYIDTYGSPSLLKAQYDRRQEEAEQYRQQLANPPEVLSQIVSVQTAPEDFDIAALQREILQDRTALQVILDKYHAASVQELSNRADALQKTSSLCQQKQTEKRFLLQNETIDTLQAQKAACSIHPDMQIPETLETDIRQFLRTAEGTTLETVLVVHESAVQAYTDTYGSPSLLQIQYDRQKENVEQYRQQLASLPEVLSPADYQYQAAFLKKQRETLDRQQQEMLRQLGQLDRQEPADLPAMQTEIERLKQLWELEIKKYKGYQRIEKDFKQLCIRTEDKLTVFYQTFNQYLARLTDKTLSMQAVDGLSLQSGKNRITAKELLSEGTKKTVLLAFRLAVLTYFFPKRNGMIVLDDDLLDMDPIRRTCAATLLQEFAQNHQVIFTTCDPAVANMLGGNVIELHG